MYESHTWVLYINQDKAQVGCRHIARDSPTNCNIKSETLFKGLLAGGL